jgi:hypothetical protein
MFIYYFISGCFESNRDSFKPQVNSKFPPYNKDLYTHYYF